MGSWAVFPGGDQTEKLYTSKNKGTPGTPLTMSLSWLECPPQGNEVLRSKSRSLSIALQVPRRLLVLVHEACGVHHQLQEDLKHCWFRPPAAASAGRGRRFCEDASRMTSVALHSTAVLGCTAYNALGGTHCLPYQIVTERDKSLSRMGAPYNSRNRSPLNVVTWRQIPLTGLVT